MIVLIYILYFNTILVDGGFGFFQIHPSLPTY